MKRRNLAMLLATAMSVTALPVSGMAEEFVTEEATVEACEEDADDVWVDDEEVFFVLDEDSVDDAEESVQEMEEGTLIENSSDEIELISIVSDVCEAPVMLFAEEEMEETAIDLTQVSAGGSTYAYVDLEGSENKELQEYNLTVKGRGGTTVTTYSFTDLKQLPGTEYYYIVTAGVDMVNEIIFAYTDESAETRTYAQLYSELGVDTSSAQYDAISSATNLTGFHAKDIAGTVVFGTDNAGNKVLSGVSTGRVLKALDGTAYVTALLMSNDGKDLTEAQAAMVKQKLKQNPTTLGTTGTKKVALSSAEYTTSRFGIGEFALVPDDTVSGYVWSEYWDSVYGATISNGTTTAGTIHWIDLYGEVATSGPHYNKLQIALNSGTSVASNKATVNRFDSFIEEGTLKPGKYTITVYADGYQNLKATIINPGESSIKLDDQNITYDGKPAAMNAEVTGSSAEVTYKYYSDESCTSELSQVPVDAGTYYVIASVGEDEVYSAAASEPAKIVINKADSQISLTAKTTTYTGKTQPVDPAVVKGSNGTITYSYYKDAACKNALKTAPADAGTYYAKAAVAENNNYKAATSEPTKIVINKKAAAITTKVSKKTYKARTLKKGAKAFSLSAATDSTGNLTFKKISGNKKIKVTKDGRVKVAKNTRKGNYTVSIRITSQATSNYEAAEKKVTVKVIVK